MFTMRGFGLKPSLNLIGMPAQMNVRSKKLSMLWCGRNRLMPDFLNVIL